MTVSYLLLSVGPASGSESQPVSLSGAAPACGPRVAAGNATLPASAVLAVCWRCRGARLAGTTGEGDLAFERPVTGSGVIGPDAACHGPHVPADPAAADLSV